MKKKSLIIFLTIVLLTFSTFSTSMAAAPEMEKTHRPSSVHAQKENIDEERTINAEKTIVLSSPFFMTAKSISLLQPNVEYIWIEREQDSSGNVMETETSIIVGESLNENTSRAAVTSRIYDIVVRHTWNDSVYCGFVGASGATRKIGASWRFSSCNPKYGLNDAQGVKWMKKSVTNRGENLLLEGKWYRTSSIINPGFANVGFIRMYMINSQGYTYYAS